MSGWDTPILRPLLVVGDVASFAAIADVGEIAGDVERIDWAGAADAIAASSRRPVVAIEAEGAAEALLTTHLPAIAEAAAARALPVVASFDPRDLDLFAATLLGGEVELLCAPTAAEQLAAVAIALRIPDERADGLVRETDGERLRRVRGEIARLADLLAQLAGDGGASRVDAVDDRRGGFDAGPGVDMLDPQAIRQAIRARRLRDGFFPAGLFEDPAWDMLLDLFAAELEGTRVSVSSLCIAAAVAPTTALRWIARMTEAGLLHRTPDPQDRRRAFMVLTDRARQGMRGYIGAAARAGLAIA